MPTSTPSDAPVPARPRSRRRPTQKATEQASLLGDGFAVGVATSGYQVEGGFNGDGEPHNNWAAWEGAGKAARSGLACDFWRRPEEALDRAAAIGCNAFRPSVEGARPEPPPRASARARPPAPRPPPVLARRGVPAAARLARHSPPPRGAGRAGARAVLPPLGD